MGTGALAAADLGGASCEPHPEPPSRQPTNWRTITPKKFLHCCESSRPTTFTNLGIQQREWEPPGPLTLKASGILLQNFHRTGETGSWRAQTKPSVHHQKKRPVTPTETEPDLPESVQESPVEAQVDSGLPWGQGHWIQQSWFGLRPNYREGTQPHPSTENWIKRFTEHGPTHQNKTQIPPVPPIRKLPQASYPYPSEGRQNGNHNYRKLTNLITWITALSNSVNLWAMLCRANQNGQIMVKTSGKTWSTGEGNVVYISIFALRTLWTVWKGKKTLKDDLSRSIGAQYATGEEWRNNSRKTKEAESKWKKRPVVDVTGDGSKVQCCKE